MCPILNWNGICNYTDSYVGIVYTVGIVTLIPFVVIGSSSSKVPFCGETWQID